MLDGLNGAAFRAGTGDGRMLFYADCVHPIAPAYTVPRAYYQRLRARPAVARALDEGRPFQALVPGGIPAHVR